MDKNICIIRNVNISLTKNIMSSSEYEDFGLYVYIFHIGNISMFNYEYKYLLLGIYIFALLGI